MGSNSIMIYLPLKKRYRRKTGFREAESESEVVLHAKTQMHYDYVFFFAGVAFEIGCSEDAD